MLKINKPDKFENDNFAKNFLKKNHLFKLKSKKGHLLEILDGKCIK